MRDSTILKPWMVGLSCVVLLAGIAMATIKPGLSSAGIQMVPQASWTGSTGVGGVYYKTASGLMARNPDNTETGPLGAGGGGVTSITAGSGLTGGVITTTGTIGVVEKTFSLADAAASVGGTFGAAGSFTLGQWFYFTTACTVTGGRFYFDGNGAAITFKVTLRDTTDTSQATKDTAAITVAGMTTVTFTSPVSVPAFAKWSIGYWDKSGTSFNAVASNPIPTTPGSVIALPLYAGPHYVIQAPGYGAGDAKIDTAATINQFGFAEPTFTCP